MPIQRQTLNIPFAQGLDTKNDPWQIQPGNFLVLENALFQKGNAVLDLLHSPVCRVLL